MIKRILIIQTASIGDVILATPVIEKLHAFYPDAKIDFLIKKGYESLFVNHPFLHQTLTWNKKTAKYKNLFRLLRHIRAQQYDVVVNLQRFASTGFLTAASRAKQKIGFDKNPLSCFFTTKVKHLIDDKNRHEIDRNLSLIVSITDNKRVKPKLYPDGAAFEKVASYKQQEYICVAPASLWFTKQFPETKWIDFLKAIPDSLNVYLLGSKEDTALCERIGTLSAHSKVGNLAGKLSLLESAALMRDAKMNFVNDSSPMHLCSSLNAPTTAIFCSTVVDFGFGPLSDNAVVVETDERLNCRPCGLHGFKSCPKKHFCCAESISIDKLIQRL